MKHILFILLFFLPFVATLRAQTVRQQGYVRTVGRPDNRQGTRLSGAVLRVSGQHNAVQSGQRGAFTLVFGGGQSEFSFSSVRLAGYDLQEKELIGRRYAVSATVPVEVVLVPQVLKRELESRVRAQVEANYQRRLKRIEAQKARLGQEYEKKLAQLEEEYEKRDRLVDDMVDRYASTDYARLTPFAAALNAFIEAGELERADSLIATVDVAQLESDRAALAARGEKLREALSENDRAQDAATAQLMAVYRGKADIFRAQFENDSAAVYLEKMVRLDSTDVKLLLETAAFLNNACLQSEKALALCRKALDVTRAKHGDTHYLVADCYDQLGAVNRSLALHEEALDCHLKALQINETYNGGRPSFVISGYNNVGMDYVALKQSDKAVEYIQKALHECQKDSANRSHFIALCYNNLGVISQEAGKHDDALEYQLKALHICSEKFGDNSAVTATSCLNVGEAYSAVGNDAKALEYDKRALYIYQKVFGDSHPYTALCCYRTSVAYYKLADYNNAIIFCWKALAGLKQNALSAGSNQAKAYAQWLDFLQNKLQEAQ